MNLKVGIVGLPNAGKSTLFNALLKKQVAEAANYPFTTIEPNIGVVPVPDKRLETLATLVEREEHVKPPLTHATVQFVDIAGLVKGASEGEGLGNKFLSHIREVDLVVNVIRYFDDPSVVHVAGDVNPERDRGIIETELILADLQTIVRQKDNGKRQKDGSALPPELLERLFQILNNGKPASSLEFPPEEQKAVRDLQLLTMKPVLYVANVSEQQLTTDSVVPASALASLRRSGPGSSEKKDWIPGQARNDMDGRNDILGISAKVETELASLSEDEQKAYLKELGLEASGLDRLIAKAYEMLGLISFLTCGPIEARAWTITRGMKAPQAAGVIHTDFEKKFIKADVVAYTDLVALKGWKGAREAGKVRSEGKEYVMQDGDVVEFKVGN
ncbi:MAG: redox-regulated ATPase YchF [Candidatus Gottesmanbacteria bacterium]|nr:redox-regulated ATPase YchF [Candidatus Gottesmanbacteria bacterium]